uniref:Uncharacterized protein n=1 Tax=Chattonella marina TaxID=90936 RepID=D2Z227_9STRA|nr:hypothetical protein [Chattonella marina]BAI70591.1 hypothetical protein [Chattonella marina]
MKHQKKIFILSDGRIYFDLAIPFQNSEAILISFSDCWLLTNWIYSEDILTKSK